MPDKVIIIFLFTLIFFSFPSYLDATSAQLFTEFQSSIHCSLYVTLQTTAKVTKHGGTSRKHNILKEKSYKNKKEVEMFLTQKFDKEVDG